MTERSGGNLCNSLLQQKRLEFTLPSLDFRSKIWESNSTLLFTTTLHRSVVLSQLSQEHTDVPFHSKGSVFFLSPLERRRAFSMLRGHPSSHGSGRGWLVDGPKERQHRTGSRLLPRQRITVIWFKSSVMSNKQRRANLVFRPFWCEL